MAYLISDEEMNKHVSHLPGVVATVRATAEKGGARARAILSAHRAEGHSRITVSHGAVDSFVTLDDTRGQRAAAAIEYGRNRGNRGVTSGVHALRSAF